MNNKCERTEKFWDKFKEYKEKFGKCVPIYLVSGIPTKELIEKMDLCLLNDVTIEHYLPEIMEIPEDRDY